MDPQLLQQTIDIFKQALTMESYWFDYFNLLLGGFWGLIVPVIFILAYVLHSCVLSVLLVIGRNVCPLKYQKFAIFFSVFLVLGAIAISVILEKYEYLYANGATQNFLSQQLQPQHLAISAVARIYSQESFSRTDIHMTLLKLQRIQTSLDKTDAAAQDAALQNLNRLKSHH